MHVARLCAALLPRLDTSTARQVSTVLFSAPWSPNSLILHPWSLNYFILHPWSPNSLILPHWSPKSLILPHWSPNFLLLQPLLAAYQPAICCCCCSDLWGVTLLREKFKSLFLLSGVSLRILAFETLDAPADSRGAPSLLNRCSVDAFNSIEFLQRWSSSSLQLQIFRADISHVSTGTSILMGYRSPARCSLRRPNPFHGSAFWSH